MHCKVNQSSTGYHQHCSSVLAGFKMRRGCHLVVMRRNNALHTTQYRQNGARCSAMTMQVRGAATAAQNSGRKVENEDSVIFCGKWRQWIIVKLTVTADAGGKAEDLTRQLQLIKSLKWCFYRGDYESFSLYNFKNASLHILLLSKGRFGLERLHRHTRLHTVTAGGECTHTELSESLFVLFA